MNDLEIIAFEQKIIEFCNGVPIPAMTKYYILKDISQKLLEAGKQNAKTIADSRKEKEEE